MINTLPNSLPNNRQKPKFVAIPLRTLLHIAWANIRTKKLRSFLTILGVVVGIGAIFFLLSFGIGLQKLVSNQVIGDASIKSIEVRTPNSKIIKLDDNTINDMRLFPHATKVGSMYSFPGSLNIEGGEAGSIVYGVDQNFVDMTSFTLVEGRVLKSGELGEAFISKGALKALGITEAKNAIDKSIDLSIPLNSVDIKDKPIQTKLKIVGVIDSGAGTEIYIPGSIFSNSGVKVYSQAKIIADSTDSVSGLRKQIESKGFETSSPIDTLEQINQVFKFFNIMLVGFGVIGMIVAILGMFNTLTISLLERTQEIGLMFALGARKTDMRKLFIFEATLLSLIGAIVGVVLAIIAGLIVDVVMNKFASHRGVQQTFSLFATPIWLITATVLFMLVVGLLVVFFPARRAEKINPIDALRRE